MARYNIILIALLIFILAGCSVDTPVFDHLPEGRFRIECLVVDSNQLNNSNEISLGVMLDILVNTSMEDFDFLIAYDKNILQFENIHAEQYLDNWKYFEYESVDPLDGDEECQTGLIHVRAKYSDAERFNYYEGWYTTVKNLTPGPVRLVNLNFTIVDDNLSTDSLIPVYFYWQECDDNLVNKSIMGHQYFAASVLNPVFNDDTIDYVRIKPPDSEIKLEDHIYGVPYECIYNISLTMPPIPKYISYYNGGLFLQ